MRGNFFTDFVRLNKSTVLLKQLWYFNIKQFSAVGGTVRVSVGGGIVGVGVGRVTVGFFQLYCFFANVF